MKIVATLIVLLSSLMVSPAWGTLPNIHKKKINNKKMRTIQSSVFFITDPINYSYGYDDDAKNFSADSLQEVKEVFTKEWLIFVNIHGSAPLNVTSIYKQDYRTLSWVTPLKWATNSINSLNAPHEKLALLKEWSNHKYRKYITFIFIPPHTSMSFKIGLAAPQAGVKEYRNGYGVQIRLKSLPTKSIVCTLPLLRTSQLSLSKSEKKIKMIPLIKEAIHSINQLDKAISLGMDSLSKNLPPRSIVARRPSNSSFDLVSPDMTKDYEDSEYTLDTEPIIWIKEFLKDFFKNNT